MKGFMEQGSFSFFNSFFFYIWGHETEIAKVADKGNNAKAEANNLCTVGMRELLLLIPLSHLLIEYANLLVPAAKIATQRVNEYFE